MESSSISIDRTPQQIQLQQSLAAANLVESPPNQVRSDSQSAALSSQDTSSGINDPSQGIILPGPRQLTTNPGVPSTNPVTGQRQRRVGVSGPPSGVN